MSTLFPAVKALGAKKTHKIFYITAKTTTREIANNTLHIMREKGLNLRSVNITAKEKCCKMEEKSVFQNIVLMLMDILIGLILL
ncbi:hypothetical protein LZD60_09250 [Clostridium perfringens]|nr:hypothetical protein LZD60_09250 [Clostridium perfringens]